MSDQYTKRAVGAILLLVFLLSGCDSSQQKTAKDYPFNYSDWTMGTTFNVKVSELPESVDEQQLKAEIMLLLTAIDSQMSTYKQDSELSRLNFSAINDEIIVSKDLFNVLSEAQRISALSAGAFDITVGNLVNLWGFGPDKAVIGSPSPQLIEQALETTGHEQFLLDPENLIIKKLNTEIYLDLSALAKGYAVDRVSDLLESMKIENFLVEIGGELKLKGHNKDNKAWRIAVEKPTAQSRSIQAVMTITNIAVASSGDYRNFFEQNGQRYSHTIDPRTGRPITHNLVSVTVLNDSAMTADALATAFMVLGVEEGLALAEREKIAALFLVKSDNGFIEQSSKAYQNFLKVES